MSVEQSVAYFTHHNNLNYLFLLQENMLRTKQLFNRNILDETKSFAIKFSVGIC